MDTQADLDLCCSHMTEEPFSHFVHHKVYFLAVPTLVAFNKKIRMLSVIFLLTDDPKQNLKITGKVNVSVSCNI